MKRLYNLFIVFSLIFFFVTSTTSAELPTAKPKEGWDLGFGQRIAGTWIESFDGFSITYSIRADGTMTWWGSFFFGNGTGEYFNGPVFGTWKRTGLREIRTTELGYLNDGVGAFFAIARVKQVFTFDPQLETITYTGIEELFAPDQDPTDPDEIPFQSFEFSGGPIKRLNHMN